MPTLYIRTFSFKDSISDEAALEELRFFINEVVPAIQNSIGIQSAKIYSGAGALRSQMKLVVEMDDAAGYEQMLLDPNIRKILRRLYSAWDLSNSTQTFIREVTPDLIAALSSSDKSMFLYYAHSPFIPLKSGRCSPSCY